MDAIRARVVCAPKAGQQDQAIDIAHKMTAACNSDPGVTDYRWYVEPHTGHLVCHEGFVSSQAFLDHIPKNPDQADFVAVVDVVRAEMYGDPSPELRELFDQMGAVYYPNLG